MPERQPQLLMLLQLEEEEENFEEDARAATSVADAPAIVAQHGFKLAGPHGVREPGTPPRRL